jgi:hypothetical protein
LRYYEIVFVLSILEDFIALFCGQLAVIPLIAQIGAWTMGVIGCEAGFWNNCCFYGHRFLTYSSRITAQRIIQTKSNKLNKMS